MSDISCKDRLEFRTNASFAKHLILLFESLQKF